MTKVSTTIISDLQYAHDAVFVSHNSDGLQHELEATSATYTRAGLIINIKKT